MPYLGLIVMILWIVCLVDVIVADEHAVRNLPKVGWIFVVLLVPLLGPALWIVVGRPDHGFAPRRPVAPPSAFPEYDRPGRHVAQRSGEDEEFLRRCRERAEEQRRIAREQRQKNPDADGESVG
ncbi:PLD nuclease N-terminal domain-containing protein [Rhodococcus spongiicola]|uniref:PLDc_N domain-containing protein n=1 Tax=Rhodococcus spongiicola TaxID=2487352 RepID=A0A438B210_9NOCA|nr:PLD nuclease N-terminal domain-containing protein [Rhodococcus spongiicola]RVW04992.1 PLDc_N domain-containing protein [Rhodococcus spongiicola]